MCQSNTIKPEQVMGVPGKEPEIDQRTQHSCICVGAGAASVLGLGDARPAQGIPGESSPRQMPNAAAPDLVAQVWSLESSVPAIWGAGEDLKGTGDSSREYRPGTTSSRPASNRWPYFLDSLVDSIRRTSQL